MKVIHLYPKKDDACKRINPTGYNNNPCEGIWENKIRKGNGSNYGTYGQVLKKPVNYRTYG